MKKCLRCSNAATRHITEIEDGEVSELHLCEACTRKYLNQPEDVPEDLDDIVEAAASATADDELSESDQKRCPTCGISFQEFRKQGRLGCPEDYIVFAEELTPLLENLHNETEHRGKLPKRSRTGTQSHSLLMRLRKQMAEAIEEEQYEDAARLRDEIEELEAQLKQEESAE